MLYLNNSADNFSGNAPSADAIFSQARKDFDFVRQNAPQHIGVAAVDMDWTTFGSRRYGKDANGLMALARECRDYFADLRKSTEARLQGERDRLMAHQTAGATRDAVVQSRAAYASANLGGLYALEGWLSTLRTEVLRTFPVNAVMNMPHTATAPIGTDAELAGFLDDFGPRALKTIKGEVDALRAGIASRSKAAA